MRRRRRTPYSEILDPPLPFVTALSVKNEKNDTRNFLLTYFLAEPTFSVAPVPKITAFTDQITEIKCDVEGFPSPKIEWRRQGNKELPFERHYIRNNNLYLRNPIKADEDIYMCHASNPAGSVMGGTEVTVQTYGEFV